MGQVLNLPRVSAPTSNWARRGQVKNLPHGGGTKDLDVRHRLLFAFAAFAAVGLASIVVRSAASENVEISPAKKQDRPGQLLGAGSCAAAACHNSPDTSKIKGREYAICITDKHDQAYAVLLEDRSKKIEQRFRGLPDWQSAQPERDVLCLKCHVHPEIGRSPMMERDGVRQFRLEDGVSCEACHGPAERWLDRHHRPEWKALSAAEKQTHFGMTDTHSIRNRARVCIDCHIGAPGMEVDHDLIAAGHPRLAFEFAGSHSLLTKHWDDAADRDRARGANSNFEAEAWSSGQIQSLRASLELLHHRLGNKAWPEFAAFDCYACHHDLRSPGTKQDRAFPGRTAGRLTANPWPASQAEAALTLLTGRADPEIMKSLRAIDRELTQIQPNKEMLRFEIPKAVHALDAAMHSKSEPMSVPKAMALIAKTPPRTWDDAAQTYSGLVAMEKNRIDRKLPAIPGLRNDLGSLRQLLLPDARYRLDDVGIILDRIKKSLPQ